jgi:hypothetical protein
MTADQVEKLEEIDRHARAEHASIMEKLDPDSDPNTSFSLHIDPPVD